MSAIPFPVSGLVPRNFCCTAVVLLSSSTHCGFVGCCRCFFLQCAVLYYCVKPSYRPSSGMARPTNVILYIVLFVRYTLPRLWHSSTKFLLYCCCTAVMVNNCGFEGCRPCFFLQCAALNYCCTTYCLCTGWLGGSVRDCVQGFLFSVFFGFCFPRYKGPALA